MPRRRFRWTRKNYRQAHHLARLMSRFRDLPDEPPPLVQRYFDLWEGRRDTTDPLSRVLSYRLMVFKGDDIPF